MPDPSRTLLVLGASIYQLPVIQCAKRLGHRVVTTDNVPANPGHALADASYAVDTTKPDEVLAIAKKERIAGVIAPCTDVAVPTAAHVARALDLAGPPVEAAAILCDKGRFRAWLDEVDLPRPRFVTLDDPSAATLPSEGAWVLKPKRSSGSKGIFVVRTNDELRARLPETLAFGPAPILEEFLPGEQLTCEGLLADGAVAAAWVTKRITADLPYVATWGHRLPSGLGAEAEAAVVAAVHDVMKRLGVTKGPFDADVVWDGTRAFLIEATPRLGGNSLSRLLAAASSYDLVEQAVRCAMGLPFGTKAAEPRASAIVLLGTTSAGTLAYDAAAADALRGESWVVELAFDKRVGDRVEPFINGRHRVGEAIVVVDDARTLETRCTELKQRLAVRAV